VYRPVLTGQGRASQTSRPAGRHRNHGELFTEIASGGARTAKSSPGGGWWGQSAIVVGVSR
jgi:hypothetical protein